MSACVKAWQSGFPAGDYSNGLPLGCDVVSTETKQDQPILELSGPAEWERWLEEHHDGARGVWLKFAKKGTGVTTVDYGGALEVALCFGWIDGQVARYDETYYLQRFTPRGPKSKWSQINRQKVEALIEQGRMRPAGQAAIDAAQADGRWDDAYAPASRITVPEDFQRALDANPQAEAFFATLTGSRRYAFLYRLHHVKRADARAKRIDDYIERLNAGRTLED
jgi:uncharacterized protein YdeI (YjbR/CyaY-like superfamily)